AGRRPCRRRIWRARWARRARAAYSPAPGPRRPGSASDLLSAEQRAPSAPTGCQPGHRAHCRPVYRSCSFGNRVGNALDVLADIPLGQKERAVLLKVGQTQILVGVAPGRVNTLHVLAEPIELSRSAVGMADGRPSFKALMLRSLGK